MVMNHQPINAANDGGIVQLHVNIHQQKRASKRLVFSRILKVGLAISFWYAALSQAYMLKKWAGQNPNSVNNDDDTPRDFFWKGEAEEDAAGGDDNWSRQKTKRPRTKAEVVFDGITVGKTQPTLAPVLSSNSPASKVQQESNLKSNDETGVSEDHGKDNININITNDINININTDESEEKNEEESRDEIEAAEEEFKNKTSSDDAKHETSMTKEPQTIAAASKEPPPRRQVPQQNARNLTLPLIPRQDVDFLDKFSDSWLVPKQIFLALNVPSIDYVEQACFQIMQRRDARMTLDWTDFMVEHLSKWWSRLNVLVDMDKRMFDHTIHLLSQFIDQKAKAIMEAMEQQDYATSANGQNTTRIRNNSSTPPTHSTPSTTTEESFTSPLHPTIGIIAYQTYSSVFKEREKLLSPHSLAASLMPLVQYGFGRIVVVGYKEDDWKHSWAALTLMASKIPAAILTQPNTTTTNVTTTANATTATTTTTITTTTMSMKLGHTEIAYVQIPSQSWVKTKAYKINMPRGALLGMVAAIKGKLTKSLHNSSAEEWLGTTYDRSYWKYFYLTEPDTILHTKMEALPLIRDGLDQGTMYLPHRLQPLPHEYNLPPAKEGANQKQGKEEEEEVTNGNKHLSKRYKGGYLPGDIHPFSNITFLDQDDHCCDAGKGWPGRSEEFGEKQIPCGTWWWGCGFTKNDKEDIRELKGDEIREKHKRLLSYPMMSLNSGTGIIFGPTEQGRKCFPSKQPCSFTSLE
ncbi:MAG: hypothetical protein SGBAC_009864 [Bacillariaceae sp.]